MTDWLDYMTPDERKQHAKLLEKVRAGKQARIEKTRIEGRAYDRWRYHRDKPKADEARA